MEKLRKHISVDIYGSCMGTELGCQDDQGDCMGMVNRTYKVGFDNNKSK